MRWNMLEYCTVCWLTPGDMSDITTTSTRLTAESSSESDGEFNEEIQNSITAL